MDRRDFLKTIGAGAASLAIGGCLENMKSSSAGSVGDKPNIILFISDDHGWEDSGCYGNNAVRTPNIDHLATEGMRFTHSFAGSPTCTPSRSVIYTGLMPLRNGAHPNHSRIREGTRTLAHYLKELGYRVVLAGKKHIYPLDGFGFEYLDAAVPEDPDYKRDYRREALDIEAVDRLLAEHSENRSSKPLCLIIASWAPHVKWRWQRYDPADVIVPGYMVDTPLTRRAIARYYTDITLMDGRLGSCLKSLDRYNMKENTLFVYTADQGAQFPHAKWTLYDPGIHTPFIARWPGKVKRGKVCDAMISFADITPTFVDAAGGAPNPDLDGRSFLGVLGGNAKEHRQEIFATHTAAGRMNDFPIRCVRTRSHKYILNLKPENEYTTPISKGRDVDGRDYWESWLRKAKSDEFAARIVRNDRIRPPEELYDLRNDPYELNNIAADPANRGLLASMRKKVQRWMEAQGDKGRDNPPVEID